MSGLSRNSLEHNCIFMQQKSRGWGTPHPIHYELWSTSSLWFSCSCFLRNCSFNEISFCSSVCILRMHSVAFLRITTLAAFSLLATSGISSRNAKKLRFSSFRRCRSSTLWVLRLSLSSESDVRGLVHFRLLLICLSTLLPLLSDLILLTAGCSFRVDGCAA